MVRMIASAMLREVETACRTGSAAMKRTEVKMDVHEGQSWKTPA
jgi:hypothetical protein